MTIDKEAVRRLVLDELERQAAVLEKAVASATEGSTHPDAKQEGKYDTRAIEAGYIAGAQMERLKELRAKIALMAGINLPRFGPDEPVGPTALVTLRWQKGHTERYFIVPHVGGIVVEADFGRIIVITPASDLGEALLDAEIGDEISVVRARVEEEAEILAID